MDAIMIALLKVMPFVSAFAAGGGALDTTVKWIGGIGGAIVAIFLIVGLIKDGIGLATGSGDSSILKVISKALFLILIIGLIFAAQQYDKLGATGQKAANKIVDAVDGEINNAL